MIRSFKCKETEKIFQGTSSRKINPKIQRRAFVKLQLLDVSLLLDDLKIPPSNHLESLSGDRKGSYSMRINDQYRLCFRWIKNEAHDVEIVDYH